MNQVALIGRLVRDPEVRYSQSANSTAVCKFTVAVDRQYKREGEQSADFINCVAFKNTAEMIGKFFAKGRRIGIVGHIQTGSYKDKEDRTVYTTDVIVDNVTFCDSQNEPAKTKQNAQKPAPAPQPDPEPVPDWEQDDLDQDSLPF